MLRLYTVSEIMRELGLTDTQVRHRIRKLNIPVMRESGGRGRSHLLAPIEPFLAPFPTRNRKAR